MEPVVTAPPRAARTMWTDERLTRLGWAFCLALLAAIIIGVASDTDRRSALMAGDFPGFYSPAVIVQQGNLDKLYDINEHHRIQREAWPSFGDNMYISVYPPYFSILLSPLGKLSPNTARWLWTGLSVLAYGGTLFLLRNRSPALHAHFFFVAVSLLLFMPIFYGVLGGQNSAFSLLLYVGGVRLLQSKRVSAEALGGALFGLWLFKPQFGLLAGLYLLLRQRWVGLLSFLGIAALYWGRAALLVGPHWVTEWMHAAVSFGGINYQINDYQMTSFAGLLSTLAKLGVVPPAWALPLAVLISLGLLLFVLARKQCSEWILAPLIILISPQTLFYDMSLALVSCLRFLSFQRDRDVTLFLCAGVGLGVIFALRHSVPVALPCFAAIMALSFVLRHAALGERRF